LYINAYVQKSHDFHHHRPKHRRNLLHPGALSAAKEKEKERHSARARNNKKKEIQKNREKDPPEPRKKTREEIL
jgi:hypothetical protein|tara:strand:- start:3085 stop:3306 length:222 start_codon:yes stop_codon:yes gene_type:complete